MYFIETVCVMFSATEGGGGDGDGGAARGQHQQLAARDPRATRPRGMRARPPPRSRSHCKCHQIRNTRFVIAVFHRGRSNTAYVIVLHLKPENQPQTSQKK